MFLKKQDLMYQILIKNNSRPILLWWCIWCCSVMSVQAQHRGSLEKSRNKVAAKIQKTSQAIWKTRSVQKKTTKELNYIHSKLLSSESSIQTLELEVDSIHTSINRKKEIIAALNLDVVGIRNIYKKVVREWYRAKLKRQSTNTILVHETSNKLNQKKAYLEYLTNRIKIKLKTIQKIEEDLFGYLQGLESSKAEILVLLEDKQSEKEKLAYKKNYAVKRVSELKEKEKLLRLELKKNRRQKIQLSQKIEQIIKEQIAAAKKAARRQREAAAAKKAADLARAKRAAKQRQSSSYQPTLIPENVNNTSKFATQKGRLMSPIYQGRVVANFGKRKHPTLKDVYINNNGIDIKGQYNSVARNVYEGVVVSVFAVPGMNNAVMVKHGDYFTTYSNIAQVYVKQGQAVKTGAQLGSIGRDTEKGGHLLHFEIWNGKQKENPAHWLAGH